MEQLLCLIVPPGADGVMVELDDRCQVLEGCHLIWRGDGGEIVPQASVDSLLVGQAVVGVLPHYGVQVVPPPLRVESTARLAGLELLLARRARSEAADRATSAMHVRHMAPRLTDIEMIH